MKMLNISSLILSFVLLSSLQAQPKKLDLPGHLKTFINNYCVECHNAKKSKGGTRLDNVIYSINNEADAQNWKDILDVLNVDDMPPEKAKQPTINEKSEFIGGLTENLETARQMLVDSGGEILIRHMNKREYKNVLFDLLGVDIKVDELPTAPKSEFDTLATNQHFSPVQFDTYYLLAQKAIYKMLADEKIKKSAKPNTRRHQFEGKKAKTPTSQEVTSKSTAKELFEIGAVLGGHKDLARALQRQKIHVGQLGTYKYKLKAATVSSKADPNAFVQIDHGHRNDPELDTIYLHPLKGTLDKPEYIEFSLKGSVERSAKFTLNYYNSGGKKAPMVWYDWIEISGPYFEKNTSLGYKLISSENLDQISPDAVKSLLRNFATLAFRSKKPSEVFLSNLNKHFDFIFKNSGDLKDSVIKSLAVIMTSPHFLYISEYNSQESRVTVNDSELAHRLSFFLWSSLPDQRLRQIAKSGKLKDVNVLSSEIDRMLADPKSKNFSRSFVNQWLDIWKLEVIDANKKRQKALYHTKYTMMEEPVEFFHHLIISNSSAVNLVDSNFVVVDPALANFYGLKYPAVKGNKFLKVDLPENSPRGGILGQASVLTITSRIDRTSPIDRGAYVLRKLLNSPPPEPPANVPDADFNAKGKTMRQILELHQSKPQCSSCHKKIDPLGFAMENFNQFGQYRDSNADTKGKMPDGLREFKGFNTMKKMLVEDKEKFIEGFCESLISYALGRKASFTDDQLIRRIIKDNKDKNFLINDLIKSIVLSNQFMKK